MLISKFNRLIRNKILWGIFAFLVCVSFVGFFTNTSSCDFRVRDDRTNPNAIAWLNDMAITAEDVQMAKEKTDITLTLQTGQRYEHDEKFQSLLTTQAWRRIATMKVSRELDVMASDDEVIATIQNNDQYFKDGAFSKSVYFAFLQHLNRYFGVTMAQFEDLTRENLSLQKVQRMLGTAAWIAPSELDRTVASYADTFQLKYVTLDPQRIAGQVEVSDEDARAFYDDNTNTFQIPEKVRVKFVVFPATNYLTTTNVYTDEQMETYYDNHRTEFLEHSPSNAADTRRGESAEEEKTRPLSECKAEIKNKLDLQQALEMAVGAAEDFSASVTPLSDKKANESMETLAVRQGMALTTSEWFSLEAHVPGISAGRLFNKRAFALELDPPEDAYSGGIAGTNAAYMMQLIERAPARLPPYAEVADKVKPLATAHLQAESARKHADGLRKTIQTALRGGQTFEQALGSNAMNIVTTEPFTAFTAPDDLADYRLLAKIVQCNASNLTEVMFSTNGLVLGYVATRIPAETAAKETVYRQVLQSLTQHRTRLLFAEWQNYLVKNLKFADSNLAAEVTGVGRTNAPSTNATGSAEADDL